MSARTTVERVSGDLADCDAVLLLLLPLLSKLDLLYVASRADGLSGISSLFHAGSLATVGSVKYGVSSLMDFVSERLHCHLVLCHLVLCACWHDGSETVVLKTLRATLSGSCPASTASNAVHSDSQVPWCDSQLPKCENPRQTLHTVDEDNHVIDSFLASSQLVAVPFSTGYVNFDIPRLFFDLSSTQLSFWSMPTMMSG